jgi:hypothetical protein
MYALYCWRSDCLCPAGLIILSECGDIADAAVSKEQTGRIRADIIHIYVPEWSRGVGIGHAMIQKLQEGYDVIHTPVAESKEADSLLKDCNFLHDTDNIDWHWSRPQKRKIIANAHTNKALAMLLGWTNIDIRDIPQEKGDPIKIYVGIPPTLGEPRPIPSWSQDKALALGLLVDLGEHAGLDYQWWKMGETYSCGVRNGGDSNASYKNEDVSPWYNSFPMAICHALIVYLSRLAQSKAAAEQEEPAKMTPELAKECAKASSNQFSSPNLFNGPNVLCAKTE